MANENDKKYRAILIDSLNKLSNSRHEVFYSAINLAMSGELAEWNKGIEVGEVITLDKSLLESCEDTNIRLLTSLLIKIEDTFESLANLNSIGQDELDNQKD